MFDFLKKFWFKFLAVLGFLATLISIYSFFTDSVNIKIDLISVADVISFNEDISNLQISYKDTNLKTENKRLKLVVLKFTNNGSKDILKEFFDIKDLFWLEIVDWIIADKTEIITSSSPYINKNIKFDQKDNFVYIEPIIFDKDSFFIVRLLILADKNSTPKLKLVGKIAGFEAPSELVNLSNLQGQADSFIFRLFSGDWYIQLLRIIFYSAASLLLLMLISLSSFKVNEYKNRKIRKQIIQNFKKSSHFKPNIDYSDIFNFYSQDNFWLIFAYQELNKPWNQRQINYWLKFNLLKKVKWVYYFDKEKKKKFKEFLQYVIKQ